MIFEIKERSFHNEFFETMRPKNLKQIITKRGQPVLLKYSFIKSFEGNSRRDFDFLSCSMKFQQKSKKFEIFIDLNQNLMIFEIKKDIISKINFSRPCVQKIWNNQLQKENNQYF